MARDSREPQNSARVLDFASAAGSAPGNSHMAMFPGWTPGRGSNLDPSGQDVIVHVVATRAGATRVAPVVATLARRGAFRQVLMHASVAGESPDRELIGRAPMDHVLEVEGDTHATQ